MKRVTLITKGRTFNVGEKIDVTAKVLTANYAPLREEDVTLVARNRETLAEQSVKLPRDRNREGFYEGAIFLKEGTWELFVDGYRDEEILVVDVRQAQCSKLC